ncbi:MAG: valine--tRNA ligase [Gammaproteobacteria bacterium]|nr:valine--tRNA ligase [Gammaproteobacteria bacterium]MCI0591089.1 valine--tRNA ligase [Gammaproteobacteria bacterium]
MDKTYNPHAIEERWYTVWEEHGYFMPRGNGPAYCIMLPPPNVTGSLHMGHAFQDTLMDVLIRYHRMKGDNTLWQCGTDHAGIATQMVVERQLAEKGETRYSLGREQFIEAIWQWKVTAGDDITQQLRRMGSSMDWSRERFTLDKDPSGEAGQLSRAVREVFVRLYNEGLIYRGKRLVNWDPVLHTAISDLEVISTEEDGHLWHIHYPLADGSGSLTVSTTRPETMLGDVAVAVHPDDARYRHAIGKELLLPLAGRTIPVLVDEHVDPAFGTGCVKVTPAHDHNDYRVWTRHKEELAYQPLGGLINIFKVDARLKDSASDDISFAERAGFAGRPAPVQGTGLQDRPTYELIPKKYRGMDRYDARKEMVRDLETEGLLARVEEHRLMVPRGDRSHAVIEPYLTDQWFVKVGPLAKPAIEAVEKANIRFVPESWAKTYFEWMRNIEDWCISRQIWWGHRIPAWYDSDGQVYVGHSENEAREKARVPADVRLKQDPDVLDTWFSSALWPFSTLGWPDQTSDLARFYPTSVLVTGFDIIFFWVARMIIMGLKFTGQVPFREVYIHGLVRDADGQKMSKSKGNILDPLDLIDGIELGSLIAKRTSNLMYPAEAPRIEKATRAQFPKGIPAYGTDALRFTFASLATQGRDIRFDLGRTEGYRNFCNKLWNAARYVLLCHEGQAIDLAAGETEFGLAERWIRSRIQQANKQVIDAIESYRFDLAAQAIYEFTWDEYCDWYLELSKTVLTNPNSSDATKRGTMTTLVEVLERLLRLCHPFMPFITEEIWQRVASLVGTHADTVMLQPYPAPEIDRIDEDASMEMNWIKIFVLGVRRIRAEMTIPPGKHLPILTKDGTPRERIWLERNHSYLRSLAKIESIRPSNGERSSDVAATLAGEMTLLIPLKGLIDRDAERERLSREIARLQKDLARSEQKLKNNAYVERAPADVVEKERRRFKELGAALAKLKKQRSSIEAP